MIVRQRSNSVINPTTQQDFSIKPIISNFGHSKASNLRHKASQIQQKSVRSGSVSTFDSSLQQVQSQSDLSKFCPSDSLFSELNQSREGNIIKGNSTESADIETQQQLVELFLKQQFILMQIEQLGENLAEVNYEI